MRLSDTEVRQLAGVIADTLENGEDYILFETAQVENDKTTGLPVVQRRTFEIRIEERFYDQG